ncbi:hypothetical protein [Cellulomonas sp. Y8]|uniref:hypothetical protein n=1 Tax=Cellulomonas sp. Y8 TaxID=2591145 RepID=UPI001FEFD32A|nr:hypothetical protein [Cellulomonas sp. Y8]
MTAVEARARAGGADGAGSGGAGGSAGRRVLTLAESPGLGGLYARAGLASGRAAVGGPVRRVLGGVPGIPGGPDAESPRTAPALPSVEHRLGGVVPDPARLTAYQHLVGEPASDVLPAGFVHVLTFPVGIALIVRPDFPMPPLGIVHLANRVEQRSPLRVGDVLDIRSWAEDLRPHRKGAQVELVAEVRRAGAPPTSRRPGAGCRPTWRRGSGCPGRSPRTAPARSSWRPCPPVGGRSTPGRAAGTPPCRATPTPSTCTR